MSDHNPANDSLEIPEDFQPMSTATQRLKVDERPGWHRHWFRGDPGRIAKARRAGYRHVLEGEVRVNNFDLGGSANADGNSDLGTLVSVISGDEADPNTGQPGKLYLMECPDHLYEKSKAIIDQRNDDVAAALRGGTVGKGENGETPTDAQKRYMKGPPSDLFTPNKTRRP